SYIEPVPHGVVAHHRADRHRLDIRAPFGDPPAHRRVERDVFDFHPKLAWAWFRNWPILDGEDIPRQRPWTGAACELDLAIGVGHRQLPIPSCWGQYRLGFDWCTLLLDPACKTLSSSARYSLC